MCGDVHMGSMLFSDKYRFLLFRRRGFFFCSNLRAIASASTLLRRRIHSAAVVVVAVRIRCQMQRVVVQSRWMVGIRSWLVVVLAPGVAPEVGRE